MCHLIFVQPGNHLPHSTTFGHRVYGLSKADGINMAREIINGVTDVGVLKRRPEIKGDLCHLVAHACAQGQIDEVSLLELAYFLPVMGRDPKC
eukprot:1735594-Amphidinium_carterae.1